MSRMDAFSTVLLITVVVRACPFHSTLEVATKPVPVTFKVKAPPPAIVPRRRERGRGGHRVIDRKGERS